MTINQSLLRYCFSTKDGKRHRIIKVLYVLISIFITSNAIAASDNLPVAWEYEWQRTNFDNRNINFSEIISSGSSKNGTPAIDQPHFEYVPNIFNLSDNSPLISVTINDDSRAYPIEVLMFHEIVNDEVGGVPIVVTYYPLTNSAMVYMRVDGGKIIDFGVSGKLRRSNMIMYDRKTQSWWQQFTGKAIVGKMANHQLKRIPAKIESFGSFKTNHPHGLVLTPSDQSYKYGQNPYVNYDISKWPFLYKGHYDELVPPLSYVVMVEKDAWPLGLLRSKKYIKYQDIEIFWTPGQASALERPLIRDGRDIGNVTVTRDKAVIAYSVPFAFAFKAFYHDGVIHE